MLSPKENQAIRSVFSQFEQVAAVYVFGSVAEGRRRAESDIDLGVVAVDETFADRKLDVLAALVDRGVENVDIVILNGADTVTRFEVVRHNELVYSTPVFDRGQYYSRVVRKYLDLQPHLERQREAYKRRVSHGSS